MMKAKPCPVANVECDVMVGLVIVLLGVILGVEKMLPNLSEEHILVLEPLVEDSDTSDAWLVGHHRGGERRYTTSNGVAWSIVSMMNCSSTPSIEASAPTCEVDP